MAYVPVPKDLSTVKTKVMFNLTKRQLICFGSGAAVAVPLFFLCKTFMNTTVAAILMILTLLPFMLMAMYEVTMTVGMGVNMTVGMDMLQGNGVFDH